MKKIFALSLLLLAGLQSSGQGYTTLTSGSGSFAINGSSYPLNTIILNVFRDSNYVELDLASCVTYVDGSNCVKVGMKGIQYYIVDGDTVSTFSDIYDFYTTYMVGGGGGSGAVDQVTGGYGANANPTTGNVVVTGDTTEVASKGFVWNSILSRIDSINFAATGSPTVTVSSSVSLPQSTVSGNAGTATALQNTRAIYGQNFNGSADVSGIAVTSGMNMKGSTSGTVNILPAATTTSYTWIPPSSVAASTGMVIRVTGISSGTVTTEFVDILSPDTYFKDTTTTNFTTSMTPIIPVVNKNYSIAYNITAQAGDILFNNPNVTMANGQKLRFNVKGTAARTLTYGSAYLAGTDVTPLPASTTTTKMIAIEFEYNSNLGKLILTGKADGF